MLAALTSAHTSPPGNHGKHALSHAVRVFVVVFVTASVAKSVKDTAVLERLVVPNLFRLLHATELVFLQLEIQLFEIYPITF